MDEPGDPSRRFTVTVGPHEDFIVARVAGDLDYQTSGLLHRQVKDAWQAAGSAGLVLDLSGVTFCDSMGVGVLVLLLRQSREQQSSLVLSNLPPLLERILAITGLRSAFHVEGSAEQAVPDLFKHRPSMSPRTGSSSRRRPL
ncbi:anti-anti-sigma factor [Nonomuraea thailandensis]|uniref:Anti-sigma factor antagonist n=1 Tax=Nonomuraea thailandensis TaxID=1188745 RepID=A0A9X2GI98_9ACTN|nr:STAS domain-containing protein [Nonomuraea thailandensis]MCP2358305.1 anti-anti-sigma factor [Nonomuraea thailandensis]